MVVCVVEDVLELRSSESDSPRGMHRQLLAQAHVAHGFGMQTIARGSQLKDVGLAQDPIILA